MATIYVDNEPCWMDPGQNLLHNCLSLGFDLPYFCWHPALGSVGACRQCAVKQYKDEHDTRGRIVMACMTPAVEGARISLRDPEAVAFRAAVIEGLMLNHPHDCPVCDEGGECHLQDMTVMTGHDYRRTTFNKRTFQNQYLGPLVNHEMNRCIQCYRCVRFYREYAGGHDLNAFALRNTVFFGRHQDGVLENEFAGNLVEVCPTGVFTDATLKRHYTRKWDLQMAPSVCVHCSLGCNVSAAERYGTLRRIVNRYHGGVNGYFLCDRGRFGYEFVNSDLRIRVPRLRREGKEERLGKAEILSWLGGLIGGTGRIIGIGSPRATLESNFALRSLVGVDNFYTGMSDDDALLTTTILEVLNSLPVPTPSLHEVELSDAVLILGEDVTNYAPRMALSLRQSVRQAGLGAAGKLGIPAWQDHAVRSALQGQKRGPLFIAAPNATRLDDIAWEVCRAAPVDVARLGFAVARALDESAPGVPDLDDARRSLAQRIADALRNAERPLVISGPGCRSREVIRAAANVACALHRIGRPAGLSFTAPECNSVGLGMLGGAPLGGALQALLEGKAETVIILENDLYRRAPREVVDAALGRARHVIALDHLESATTAKAEAVLPAGAFAESEGTLVNNECRAQRFFRVYNPAGDVQESWRWLAQAMAAGGMAQGAAWEKLDDLIAALADAAPALAGIRAAAASAEFRMAGARVPREPHRYSGRTAMLADISVHEPKPPEDADSPLSFSMEGSPNQPPAALIPYFWAPGWNSIQAANKYQNEIAGALRGGDSGVRLVEPRQPGVGDYFREVPRAFQARAGAWLLLPLYHIFGSEELSLHAPGIAELVPKPYLALNAEDCGGLGLKAGEEAVLKLNGLECRLPVRVECDLPHGVAGIPAGLSSLEGFPLPAWCSIGRT